MSVPIGDASSVPLNSLQANTQAASLAADVKETLALIKADLINLSDELSQFGAAMKPSGKESGREASHIQNQQKAEQKPGSERLDQAAQAAMVDTAEEEQKIRKKKREEKKFQEKINELSAMAEQIDLETLTEDERHIVEQFFKDVRQIKEKKGRLRQLDEQEERYQMILDQHEMRQRHYGA